MAKKIRFIEPQRFRKMSSKENKSQYAILGILASEPASGYAIKKAITDSTTHFWKESDGSIYPILKRLGDEGLIETVQEKARNCRVYAITKAGQNALVEWLERKECDHSVRNEFLLKIFFSKHLSKEVRRVLIKQYQTNLQSKKNIYKGIETMLEKEQHPETPFWKLTLRHGMLSVDAALTWCQEALRTICVLIFFLTSALCAQERPLGLTSLDTESTIPVLEVQGEVPEWLSGTLIRNGPAKFDVDGHFVSHWFDGLAMLHAFYFDKGNVSYKNRFLKTSAYTTMMEKKSIDFSGFKQEGSKVSEDVNFYPNANVNVALYSDSLVALTETPCPLVIDPKSLDTLSLFDYTDTLPHRHIWESAHPHYDPKTGEIINYLVRFGKKSHYVLYTIAPHTKTRKVLCEIPVDEPSYMHSFAITDRFIVFVAFPFVANPQKLLEGKSSFIEAYRFKEDKQTTIYVVDKATKEVVDEATMPPCFAYHHINAFEDAGSIVFDLAAYPDASVITGGADKQKQIAHFQRWRISYNKVTLEFEGPAIEMPRIDYDRYNTKPYRYVYAVDDEMLRSNEKRALIKFDVTDKSIKHWSEEGCFAGEPVFVSKPSSTSEDDGVILSCVLDTKSKRSFLLILDAKSFREIGRAFVTHHIPFDLHGMHLQ